MGNLEKKEDARESRLDAAQRLTRLAGIIAQGRADILGRDVILGDEVISCWGITVRDGFIHYDLSLKIPLSETGQQESCGTPKRAGDTETGTAGGRGGRRGRGRHRARKYKKTTGALWKIIKKAVQEKKPVSDADAAALTANLSQYDQFVKDEWRPRWEQCVQSAAQCMEAAGNGDYKTAEALIKEVNELTKACHKRYK